MNDITNIYPEIPGGPDLLDWFGCVPIFHDAEILSFDLQRTGTSTLRIHAWNTTRKIDDRGYSILEKHAVVTFSLKNILDLELNGFNRQNVIGSLILRHLPDRPDRKNRYSLPPLHRDYEIELEPCFGIDGVIRCREVSITVTPGIPPDTLVYRQI